MFLNRSSTRHRRSSRGGARVLFALAPLALAVALAVPAVAQAEPQWFMNGIRLGSQREGVQIWGHLQVQSSALGKTSCQMNASGAVWNESEKGLGANEFIALWGCTTEPAVCPEGGVILTAEAPIALIEEKVGTEKHYKAKRGLSSLPWPEELSENTEKQHRLTIRNVKLTQALPCIGLELPTEGTLEASYVNGTKNGLSPSHWVIGGKLSESPGGEVFPPTGEAIQVGSRVQLLTVK